MLSKHVDTPRALLETHPTLPNQRALMVTLVPKFALPPIHPEIVLIADRSGSMDGQIPTLISALKVFLKSMPVGTKFNICSFGSHHSFLWPKSQSYNQTNLQCAIEHVQSFHANFGGTEMFGPIKDTIERRYTDMPLEVMLLTDGETWNQSEIFSYLNTAVGQTGAPVRVFTLGIGSAVSSALIEGVARAGNGFSQTVHESEKLDGKVVRMLKGALTPHVSNYTLEVRSENDRGDGESEVIEKVIEDFLVLSADDYPADPKAESSPPTTTKPPVSLFDPTVILDNDGSGDVRVDRQDRFAHVPRIESPKIIQTPSKIPSLFPFQRTVVYLLISPRACRPKPKSVLLRASWAQGPLELEIPVETLDVPQDTIHQLAAKKVVGEMEEGRGWLFDAKDETGVPIKEKYPGRWDEIVQREAVRLGLDFQVASGWCSFIAAEGNGEAAAEVTQPSRSSSPLGRRAPGLVDGSVGSLPQTRGRGFRGSISQAIGSFASAPRISQAQKMSAIVTPYGASFGSSTSYPAPAALFGGHTSGRGSSHATLPPGGGGTYRSRGGNTPAAQGSLPPPAPSAPLRRAKQASDGDRPQLGESKEKVRSASSFFARRLSSREQSSAQDSEQGTAAPQTDLDRVYAVIALQTFEGWWALDPALLSLLDVKAQQVESAFDTVVHPSNVLATTLAMVFFRKRTAGEKETWDLVVEKAAAWLSARIDQQQTESLISSAESLFE